MFTDINLSINACVNKYADQKGSKAMLAVERSAVTTAEVNLRNPFHAVKEAGKLGFHPGFEAQGRCHQKSKTGVSVTQRKGQMSSNN